MKMLKNLLFTIILLVGCSIVAFGQTDDSRNPPPKKGEQPKVIIVPKNDGNRPKESPKNTPEQSERPKKPDNEN